LLLQQRIVEIKKSKKILFLKLKSVRLNYLFLTYMLKIFTQVTNDNLSLLSKTIFILKAIYGFVYRCLRKCAKECKWQRKKHFFIFIKKW